MSKARRNALKKPKKWRALNRCIRPNERQRHSFKDGQLYRLVDEAEPIVTFDANQCLIRKKRWERVEDE